MDQTEETTRRLKIRAFRGLTALPLVLSAALFGAAGTLSYWQGWLCIIVLTAAPIFITLYLAKNDPALLARRMKSGPRAEKRGAQKIVMWFMSILFMAFFVVGGLDYRHGWSHLPPVVPLMGDCLLALSFLIFHLVFKENTFASATIEIADGHKVISTGPYHLVRHPMYSGSLLFLLGIPLSLGSIWSLLICLPMLPVFIFRIIDEEKLLDKQLAGYSEYRAQVRYRLIPGIY